MKNKMLITGGAGFIGSNSVLHFGKSGWDVTIIDNLSRKGAVENLQWIDSKMSVNFENVDIRDPSEVTRVIKNIRPEVLLHLAAQVAVTTSVEDPLSDFEINAQGTLNMLEALRQHSPDTFFINASTNKVYGKMESVDIVERNGRYEYKDLKGVDESQPLDFHSPYGCSKGVADQYTIDYSRIYNLKTTTFRQSCIYGKRQFGIEDQGWVAWFTIASVLGKQITIYGNGKQIRDILHVDDLILAFEAAMNNRKKCNGKAFNIGGGPNNTMSLLELLAYIENELGEKIPLKWDDWRPGDQPVFICNIQKAKDFLNWEPQIGVQEGVKDLISWVRDNRNLFSWLN